MNTKSMFLCGLAGLLLSMGNNCNYYDTVATTNAVFILPPDSSVVFQMTKRYFVAIPGDTALFYGLRRCTVTTNGIVTSLIHDSAYLRTITLPTVNLTIDNVVHNVYPQLYQQGATVSQIHNNTITRYLEQTDSALVQLAYEEDGRLTYTKKNRQVVMPRTLLVGLYGWFDTDSTAVPTANKWPVSPLIKNPVAGANDGFLFDGFSVATRVIALPQSSEPSYEINGVEYTNGIGVKTYYTIHGEVFENKQRVTVLGSVQITRSYFAEMGMIDQVMVTFLQKTFADGTVEITRERVSVARGPEGAKKYSENEYPW